MKKFITDKPVLSSVIITVCYFILARIVSFAWVLPLNDYTNILYETVFIILPFVMVCFFGDKSVYKQGELWKTLHIGGYMFYVQLSFLSVMFLSSVYNPDEKWTTVSGIVLGIVSLFGVGFREESIFRGIIVNNIGKKYIKDRKGIFFTSIVSGLIFGLVHITNFFVGVNLKSAVIQSVVAFGIGFYMAAVYLRGGSLWAMIIMHSVTDGASMFKALFTVDNGTVVDMVDSLSILNLTPFFIFMLIGMFILRKKKCDEIIAKFNPINEEPLE